MSEQQWAERFSQDVDALLRGGTPPPADAAPPAYHAALHLARTLHQTDWSPASRGRAALRHRLLAQAGQPAPSPGARLWALGTPLLAGVPLVLLVGLLLLGALGSGLITPVAASPSPAQTRTHALVASATSGAATQTPPRPPGLGTPHRGSRQTPTEWYTPTGTPAAAWPSGTPLSITPRPAR